MTLFDKILPFRFLATLAFVLSATCLFAQDQEMIQLEFGIEYSVSPQTTFYGYFVSPKSGNMDISYKSTNSQEVATDPDFNNKVQGYFNNNFNAPAYTYVLKQGQTYYVRIKNQNLSTTGTFMLSMEGVFVKPFEVAYYAPQTNGETVYNFASYSNMFVRYSKMAAPNPEAEITYVSNGGESVTIDLTGNYVYTDLDYVYVRTAEVLLPLLEDKSSKGISPNAPFTISIRAKDYDGQYVATADNRGYLSFSYLCGYNPTILKSESVPSAFLSYWPKGDPSGIITLTFSQNLGRTPSVTLYMGNIEGEYGREYWQEFLPATVDGNTLTVDLTGVRRSYNDILNGNTAYNNITVSISNLYDINNMPVVSNLAGNTARYVANLPFVNLEKDGVVSDWVPSSGSMLTNTSSIEIWIKGLNTVQFTGFTVESVNGDDKTVTLIPMNLVTKSEESTDGNEAVFTFQLPDIAKTADSVTIYPTDLVALNGYEYDVYLTAIFNTFTFIAVEPSQGAEIDTLEGRNVSANFNFQDEYPSMFVTLEVIDAGTGEVIVEETGLNKDSYGIFNIDIEKASTLYLNHIYNALFTAWASENDYVAGKSPVGTSIVTWYGNTPPYQNGAAVIVEMSPQEGEYLENTDGQFKFTFDIQVNIDADNSCFIADGVDPLPFSSILTFGEETSVSPEGKDYSTNWILSVPQSYIDEKYSFITINFVAVDDEDKIVLGNVGTGENSYFSYTFYYSADTQTSEVIMIPAGSGADTLKVYNLTGTKVLETKDASDLRNLGHGIYIVNGKKIKI